VDSILNIQAFFNSEVAGDLAASKTRLLLAPNTPNKKSKTEGYETETSSNQENTSNLSAKDNMDNMSDDETDVPNKKKILASCIFKHLLTG